MEWIFSNFKLNTSSSISLDFIDRKDRRSPKGGLLSKW
jgi:hypothetical protein